MRKLIRFSKLLLLIPCIVSANELENTLTSSGNNSFFSGPKDRINIDLSKDKKNATFKFKTWRLNNRATSSIEIKAPFDKDAGQSTAGLSDGLGNATTVTFGIDVINIDKLEATSEDQNTNKSLCEKYMLKSHSETCSSGSVKKEAISELSKIKKNTLTTLCSAFDVPEIKCNKKDFPEFIALKYSKERNKIWAKETKAWVMPMRLEYGQEDFKYLDLNTFEDEKTSNNPYSASLGIGRLTNNLFWGGGIEYKKTYTASSKKDYCTDIPNSSTATQCESKNFGAPSEKISHNIFIETRYRPNSMKYAFGVKITKDVKNNSEEIEIPIYLLESKGSGLSTGIKFGWNSKDKEIVSSFFFGSSFAFFEK